MTTALSYHAQLGIMNHVSARTMGVMAITLPSETIFSSELKVTTFFGSPLRASSGGLAMDADRLMSLVRALHGDKNKPIQFMLNFSDICIYLLLYFRFFLYYEYKIRALSVFMLDKMMLSNSEFVPSFSCRFVNHNGSNIVDRNQWASNV